MGRLQEAQTVFQATGGTHAVALASPDGKVFIHAEDVGRHNAMDKVIGRAVLTRQDLTGLVALLSGRISFEMALKCVRAGIPILAAVSAPTSMALELAQELGLTTVGFVRDQRLNIYTAPRAGGRGGNHFSKSFTADERCQVGRCRWSGRLGRPLQAGGPLPPAPLKKNRGDPPGRPYKKQKTRKNLNQNPKAAFTAPG